MDQGVQRVWYTAVPDRVRYEIHGDRYALTISDPNGDGLTMFGAVTGAVAASSDVCR